MVWGSGLGEEQSLQGEAQRAWGSKFASVAAFQTCLFWGVWSWPSHLHWSFDERLSDEVFLLAYDRCSPGGPASRQVSV